MPAQLFADQRLVFRQHYSFFFASRSGLVFKFIAVMQVIPAIAIRFFA
jgi:hypothetical protein